MTSDEFRGPSERECPVAPLLPCSPAPLLCKIRPIRPYEANHRPQRRIIAQLQVVAARDVKCLPDGEEGFGLFHRVDAQVGLHVEVELQHLHRVAGLRGDDGKDFVGDGIDRSDE